MKSNQPYQLSLSISWKEGIGASIMIHIVDYYIIPLALFLGATGTQIGLLVAIPHLSGSVAQLIAFRLLNFLGTRLNFLIKGVFFQSLLLVIISVLPWTHSSHKIELLILMMTLFRISGNLVGTIWNSLMSDYLQPEQRGHYLGWRSQITGLAGMFGLILGGFILFSLKKISGPLAFFILFFCAFICRLISTFLMAQMQDITLHHSHEDHFTFFQFLKRTKESNFVKFVLFVSAITFATHFASPYISVHMLKDLHLSYLNYMFVHLTSILTGLIAFPLWGKHADLVGNAKVLKLTGLLIPWIPLFWIFIPKNIIFYCLIEAYAGFIWGGFNLCSINFIFDSVTPTKRIKCISYFNFINGIALFLGAFLGGNLLDKLPTFLGYRVHVIFLISFFLRFFSYFILSGKFTEVRTIERHVSHKELFFSMVGIRPMMGRNRIWDVLTFFKVPDWIKANKER